jgi:hypothetical protein
VRASLRLSVHRTIFFIYYFVSYLFLGVGGGGVCVCFCVFVCVCKGGGGRYGLYISWLGIPNDFWIVVDKFSCRIMRLSLIVKRAIVNT